MAPKVFNKDSTSLHLMLPEIGCAKIASNVRLCRLFISVMYRGIISNTLAAAREATLLLTFVTLQNEHEHEISVHCFSMLEQPSQV